MAASVATRPCQLKRTLMRKDHYVTFTLDAMRHLVVGRPQVHDARYLPIGGLGHEGRFSRSSPASWIMERSVPIMRPSLSPILGALGIAQPEELQLARLGLSLSDQYWSRPTGREEVSWEKDNFFDDHFPRELGRALANFERKSERDVLES